MKQSEQVSLLRAKKQIRLPRLGRWQTSAHAFDESHLDAIEAALGARRPLLVRGEPGLGKSQIARAIAAVWGWRMITASIHSRTERDDLLYRIDHVERLSESQAGKAKPIQDYIQAGPVWRALHRHCGDGLPLGEGAYDVDDEAGCVLLIDEIDKAHRDVPNTLLEVLEDGEFELPFEHKDFPNRVVRAQHGLFIVITANDERDLPPAFMRRCAVLHLELGDDAASQLRSIATSHMEQGVLDQSVEPYIDEVIQVVLNYRRDVPDGYYKPGTSEMIDTLQAIVPFAVSDPENINSVIDRMANYLIRKEFRSDADAS